MKGLHPKASTFAAMVAIALSFAAGCRTQTGSAGNPLFAPDRVPPPSTRALAPGQAQPYYQGDPLPVMQSQAPPAASPTAEPEMPSADTNLAWASPGNHAATNAPAANAPAAPPSATAPDTRAVVQSGEPTVAVPSDDGTLRFPMPTPTEPAPFSPVAPASIAAAQAPTQPIAPMQQGVVPASYSAPADSSVTPPANNPWQTPQLPANSWASVSPIPPAVATAPTIASPATYATPLPYMPAPPNTVVVPPNNMDVTLRAVPSPIPRIRMPGYVDTSVPTVSSNDGFRPRSSMR